VRRKENLYFDRKSMGFKRGIRPATKAELRASRKSFRRGVEQKVRARKGAARKQAGSLFRQLSRESKQEARGRELASKDKALWEELYGRQNPMRVFPGNLTDSERSALRKLVRLKHMSKKKKSRKKKNSPRKGKMPAGLAAYWRKKRAKKAKRKNPKRPKRTSKPRRKRVSTRVRNYRRAARKPAKRRKRRANPRPKRAKVIKAPYGMTGKRLRAWAREQGKKFGVPARILPR
jgi:hypothetical protein